MADLALTTHHPGTYKLPAVPSHWISGSVSESCHLIGLDPVCDKGYVIVLGEGLENNVGGEGGEVEVETAGKNKKTKRKRSGNIVIRTKQGKMRVVKACGKPSSKEQGANQGFFGLVAVSEIRIEVSP